MTTLTLIAVRLTEGMLAVSARDRWHGVSHLPTTSGNFVYSTWFKIGAVIILIGSIIALVVVSLYNRFNRKKIAERAFADGVSRKQLTAQEAGFLIAIANRVGLERTTDIFLMSDSFDKSADMLVKESFVGGHPTNQTGQLEKQLAALKEKMNYRKAVGGAYYSKDTTRQSAEVKSAGLAAGKWVFVALFPFSRKMDLINNDSKGNTKQGQSPPQWSEQLPKFVPAAITGLVGRVLFIETWLAANVGDRVLISICTYRVNGDYCTVELIEDVGTVDRSFYLSESTKTSSHCRLGVNLTGLSESQIAQFAESIKPAEAPKTKKQNTEDSKETANASAPITGAGESGGPK